MKRIITKISIVLLSLVILFLGLNSLAATGYSYDHNKKIIYSAEGLIYDHSFDGKALGIGYENLTSPEDFFIFRHPNRTKSDQDCMYLTDSKANAVYELDMNFNYVATYKSFVLDPTKFTNEQLAAIKSNGQLIAGNAAKVDDVITEFILDINSALENEGLIPEDGFVISETETTKEVTASNFYITLKYLLLGGVDEEGRFDETKKGLLQLNSEFEAKWAWFISFALSAIPNNEYIKGAIDKIQTIEGYEEIEYTCAAAGVYNEFSSEMFANCIYNILNSTDQKLYDDSELDDTYDAANWSSDVAFKQLLKDRQAAKIAQLREAGNIEIQLKSPSSAYRSVITKFADESVNNRDYLYVCDYGNNQVLCIDASTKEIRLVITNPNPDEDDEDAVLVFDALSFQPQKVVTDNAGRIYIIANSVYEGILQFDADGTYKRFTGVNNVTLTAWDIFWLTVSTEAQYESRKSYINTIFTSMAVDQSGTFIYCTAAPIKNSNGSVNATAMIKKLNPAGKDVLRRNSYAPPQGDLTYVADSANLNEIATGPSVFSGIAVNEYGMYTVVDNNRRRLFTYDNEGNLLYISGEKGRYTDTLDNPVAIQYYDGDVIVLDKNTKELKVFVSTEIGSYINKAVEAEYHGDIDTAADYWKKVIKFNANYEYAYVGVGKKYLKDKEYKTAMTYFKNGSNKLQYSEAYKLYRNDLIKKYAPPVLYALVGLIIVVVILKLVLKKLGKGKPKEKLNMGEDE